MTGSLWVEAASAGADPALELDWVLEQVAGSGLVEGLVAYVALEHAEDELDRLSGRPGPPVVGVRRSFEFEEPGFAARSEVVRGARLAGERGFVVDLVLFPPAFPAVLDLVASCPGTQFVLDHLGKPEIARRGWEPWASQLRELSARPNVVAKLSGLATEADPFRLDAGRPEAVRGTCASDVRAGQAALRQRLARSRDWRAGTRGGSRR